MNVDIVDSENRLNDLQAEWRALHRADRGTDIFGSPEWFTNWWRHNGAAGVWLRVGNEQFALPTLSRRLHVITVRRKGALAAVVPLVLNTCYWRRLPVRIVASALSEHSPRTGCTADGIETTDTHPIAAAFSELSQSRAWDLCFLDGIPPASNSLEVATQELQRAGHHVQQTDCWSHATLGRRESWDVYLAERGRHFRKHLWQTERALAKLAELATIHRRGLDAAETGLREFIAIDAQSWKAKDGETIANNDRLEAYYTDLGGRLAQEDRFETWTLTIGGELASSFLCLVDETRVYTLKTSFNNKFASARFSPSFVLMASIARDAWDRGRDIDFVGETGFSRRWTKSTQEFRSLLIFRKGPYGGLLRAMETARRLLRRPDKAQASAPQ